jgi:hypothetical protein
MKRLFTFLLLTLMLKVSYAQRYEVGVFVGGNNVIGDVGSTYFVSPNSYTLGGLFKWNVHDRLALRGNAYVSLVHSSYSESRFPYHNSGFSDNTGVANAELIAEWNFQSFDLRKKNARAPYMFMGLGGLLIPKIKKDGDGYIDDGYGTSLSIPFGVGYKYAITRSWVLAADLSFRYSFSDNLDHSMDKNIGNLDSNDWFTTIGLTLTYVFGRDPCACGQK